jgi:hypothetical protein
LRSARTALDMFLPPQVTLITHIIIQIRNKLHFKPTIHQRRKLEREKMSSVHFQ